MLDEARPLCHIRANSELVCGTLKRQSNGKSAEQGKHSRVGKGCVCRLFPTASPLDVAMCGRDEQKTSATQLEKDTTGKEGADREGLWNTIYKQL
ncbi:hypothetical protein Ddc_08110 [Ditylenchus destructor]|nr:hypothetical protein Ddc_08110 [Ditylenchus destructor]